MRNQIFVALLTLLLGVGPMEGQEETFTRAEVVQALGWGMPRSEAERLANVMADEGAAVLSEEEKLKGPGVVMYSEDVLLLLSLVSEEARGKAERRLAQQRIKRELSPAERSEWEARRKALRDALIKAGKIEKE